MIDTGSRPSVVDDWYRFLTHNKLFKEHLSKNFKDIRCNSGSWSRDGVKVYKHRKKFVTLETVTPGTIRESVSGSARDRRQFFTKRLQQPKTTLNRSHLYLVLFVKNTTWRHQLAQPKRRTFNKFSTLFALKVTLTKLCFYECLLLKRIFCGYTQTFRLCPIIEVCALVMLKIVTSVPSNVDKSNCINKVY